MSDNFYIQIKDGNPYDHPISEWNMRAIFPNFDPNNLPEGFKKFIRIPLRELGLFEIHEKSFYGQKNNVFQDIHIIRNMTEAEKQNKINEHKKLPHHNSWKFNESNLTWQAPKPEPQDGNKYYWNEKILDWEIIP